MLFGCLHRQLSLEWLRWSCPWLTTPNVPKPASSCPRGVLMPRCLRPGLQLGSGRFVVWMYPTLDRVSDGHAASFPAVWAIHAVIPVTVWFLPPVVGVFIISVQGLKLEVTQIIGPVVDVQLKSSVEDTACSSPVRVAQSIRAGHVTVEVQHLLGGGIFRSVAMQGTQGLRRGDPAELLPGLGSAVEPLDPSAWHVTCSGKRVWRLESSTAREAYPGDVSHHHLALGHCSCLTC